MVRSDRTTLDTDTCDYTGVTIIFEKDLWFTKRWEPEGNEMSRDSTDPKVAHKVLQ